MNLGALLAAIAGVEGLHAPVYTDEGSRSLIEGIVAGCATQRPQQDE